MIGNNVIFSPEKTHFSGLNTIGDNSRLYFEAYLGYAATVGHDCWFRGPVEIGNFTQLGPRVALISSNHAIEFLSPYNNKALFNGDLKQHVKVEPIVLGHGVWCGYGCTILKGVTIGNGAVVGAGSVVTKNIPPYHIANGNPAKVVRPRFREELFELLEQLQWWNRTVSELESLRPAFDLNFVSEHEKAMDLLQTLMGGKK